MKCLVKYTVNLRCQASSKKEAEKCLKPELSRLKSFCMAFGASMSTIIESYVPGSGRGIDIEYLFSYEIRWEGEFRHILKITSAVQYFADINVVEVTDEKITPFNDET